MPQQELVVRMRILCTPLPPSTYGAHSDIELGIQQGKEVLPGVEASPGTMRFDLEARAKRHPETGAPNFLGSYVHGPTGARFLYLNWTGWQGGERNGFGRIKVHLSSITWEQVEEASAPGALLQATVSGVNAKGAPAAASVPLLGEGWIVVRQEGDG
jgi:hypothetical protein